MIVEPHSWSYTADSLKTIDLNVIAKAKNYNYVFPNFRGVNNHPKACCSEFVINDIDECIDWALKNMNVGKNKIYVIGYSGGGNATLSMYMKSRHTIKSFSAWLLNLTCRPGMHNLLKEKINMQKRLLAASELTTI